MDPSVLGGRSPGVSQQAPLSVLRGGSATSPIYISSGESDSSADVSQPNPLVGGSQQNRYRPLSYGVDGGFFKLSLHYPLRPLKWWLFLALTKLFSTRGIQNVLSCFQTRPAPSRFLLLVM
ncbi:uncharacterized protein LOC106402890 [Brassica napus]|uniref:uncharacterized protein LOC106402890 n=1 Tax=Brassica napus TaxID=3708 RepID=UPI0006AAFBC7|nr:uncharacterized protein LOC106402890 [Brassica napus]